MATYDPNLTLASTGSGSTGSGAVYYDPTLAGPANAGQGIPNDVVDIPEPNVESFKAEEERQKAAYNKSVQSPKEEPTGPVMNLGPGLQPVESGSDVLTASIPAGLTQRNQEPPQFTSLMQSEQWTNATPDQRYVAASRWADHVADYSALNGDKPEDVEAAKSKFLESQMKTLFPNPLQGGAQTIASEALHGTGQALEGVLNTVKFPDATLEQQAPYTMAAINWLKNTAKAINPGETYRAAHPIQTGVANAVGGLVPYMASAEAAPATAFFQGRQASLDQTLDTLAQREASGEIISDQDKKDILAKSKGWSNLPGAVQAGVFAALNAKLPIAGVKGLLANAVAGVGSQYVGGVAQKLAENYAQQQSGANPNQSLYQGLNDEGTRQAVMAAAFHGLHAATGLPEATMQDREVAVSRAANNPAITNNVAATERAYNGAPLPARITPRANATDIVNEGMRTAPPSDVENSDVVKAPRRPTYPEDAYTPAAKPGTFEEPADAKTYDRLAQQARGELSPADQALYDSAQEATNHEQRWSPAQLAVSDKVGARVAQLGQEMAQNQPDNSSVATPPGQGSVSGRASWFGRNPDGSLDKGDAWSNYQGAFRDPSTGQPFDTSDIHTKGVALPFNVLDQIAPNWRKANSADRRDIESGKIQVNVTAPDGTATTARIIDAGPAEWTGASIDINFATGRALGLNDNSHVTYTVTKGNKPLDVTFNGAERGETRGGNGATEPRAETAGPEEPARAESYDPTTDIATGKPLAGDNGEVAAQLQETAQNAPEGYGVRERALKYAANENLPQEAREAAASPDQLLYQITSDPKNQQLGQRYVETNGGPAQALQSLQADSKISNNERMAALQNISTQAGFKAIEAQRMGDQAAADAYTRIKIDAIGQNSALSTDVAQALGQVNKETNPAAPNLETYRQLMADTQAKLAQSHPESANDLQSLRKINGEVFKASVNEAGNDIARISGEAPAKPLDKAVAETAAQNVRQSIPGSPDIHVVDTAEHLPAYVHSDFKTNPLAENAKAFLYTKNGKSEIYALRDRFNSEKELRNSLLEETVGHYGFEKLDPKRFQQLLGMVEQRYGNTPEFRRLVETYGQENAAREMLARLAYKEVADPSFLDRITTAAREMFRPIINALGGNLRLSDAEVRVALAKARDAVANPGQALSDGIRFSAANVEKAGSAKRNQSIRKLIDQYAAGDQSQPFSDYLTSNGIAKPDARRVLDAINEARSRLPQEQVQGMVRDWLASKGKIDPSSLKDLTSLVHSGAFSDEAALPHIARLYGVKAIDPKAAEAIRTASRNLDEVAQEGGSLLRSNEQIKAISDHINLIRSRSLGGKGEMYFSAVRSSLLSGINGRLRDLLESTVNTFQHTSFLAGENPRAAGMYFNQWFKTLSESKSDVVNALSTGVSSVHEGGRFGNDMLEATKSPLGVYKYVGRVLTSIDILAQKSNKDVAALALSMKDARKGGMSIDDAMNDAWSRVNGLPEVQARSKIEAAADAKKYGWNKNQEDIRYHELVQSGITPENREIIQRYANKVSYQETPTGTMGDIYKPLKAFSEKHPWLKPFTMFMRTPMNVVNNQLSYITPIGLARYWKTMHDTELNPKEAHLMAMTDVSKAVSGLAAVAGLTGAVASGVIQIHGAGPADIRKKMQLMNSGWRPYSVEVGGQYIPYNWTPLGLVLGLMGNVMDNGRYANKNNESWEDGLIGAGVKMASYITDNSALQGLVSLQKVVAPGGVDKPANEIAKILSTFVAPMYGGTMGKNIEQWIDPNDKTQAKGTFAQIVKDVPILGHLAGRPQLNVLGEHTLTNPFQTLANPQNNDPVWKLVEDRGIWFSAPTAGTTKLNGKLMDDQQYYDYTKIRGSIIREQVMSQMSQLQSLPKDKAQDKLEEICRRAGAVAKYRVH